MNKKGGKYNKLSDENLREIWDDIFKQFYTNAIKELAEEYPKKKSLYIDYVDIKQYNEQVAARLIKDPDLLLDGADNTLSTWDVGEGRRMDKARVGIINLPTVTEIKDIQTETDADKLLTIAGTVISVRNPEDKIKVAAFECPKCRHITKLGQPPLNFIRVDECPEHEGGCGKSKKLKLNIDESQTVRSQRITLQSLDTQDQHDIEVEEDLINICSHGDEILVTGIVRFYQRKNRHIQTPYLDWYLDINSVIQIGKEYDEKTIRDAETLLNDPNILDKIAEFLAKPGLINGIPKKVITGEENNKKLLFCVGLSAKYKRRLNAILIAQSSAGKTRLVGGLNLYFPKQVIELFRTSARALDYLGRDLDGKILLLKEMAGGEAAEYSFRIVMDPESNQLAIWTVEKDEKTGTNRTIEKKTVGTPVFVSTTTSSGFDDQTKNRAFLLPLDESQEQTRKIHEADDQQRAGILTDITTELDTHRCAIDLLEDYEVKIPFRIEYPTQSLKARRTRAHLLDLIEIVAFLRQYQRNIITGRGIAENAQTYIIATRDDFNVAKEIAGKSLSIDLEDVAPKAKELLKIFKEQEPDYKDESLETIKGESIKITTKTFYLKTIRTHIASVLGRNYSKTAVRGFLDELDNANLILSDDGNPKSYRYIIEDKERSVINSVQLSGTWGETELYAWLDTMRTTHTFYTHSKFKKINKSRTPLKSGCCVHSNGATGEQEIGDQSGDPAQCALVCIEPTQNDEITAQRVNKEKVIVPEEEEEEIQKEEGIEEVKDAELRSGISKDEDVVYERYVNNKKCEPGAQKLISKCLPEAKT